MRKDKINRIFKNLAKTILNPKTELKYINRYTFLIAVVLSAQATDKSVNESTKKLFKFIKSPKDVVNMGEKKLKNYIRKIGLYNSKAKNINNLSKILVEKYNSKIPDDFKSLIDLPGVGNKTASVYQNTILKIPRIAVDTHVFRVSNRVGLVETKNANLTQIKLEKVVPNKWKMEAHHLLILHGRRVCKAQKPLCNVCNIIKDCKYKNKQL